MSNAPPNLLTLAEVEALPALGPWHVAACHTHVPGGQFYRPGQPAPTCVAIRDAAGRPVESPQAALELQAAAPALRSTALALYAEVERLRAEMDSAGASGQHSMALNHWYSREHLKRRGESGQGEQLRNAVECEIKAISLITVADSRWALYHRCAAMYLTELGDPKRALDFVAEGLRAESRHGDDDLRWEEKKAKEAIENLTQEEGEE